jgi:hypothetical protein
MNAQKKTSPWVWILVGCLGIVVIGVVAIAAMGFLGYRWVKDVSATMNDPVARTEKVRQILGCDELPEGYYATAGFTVPFLMEIAVLSDVEVGPGMSGGQGFDERGFIYFKMLSFGAQDQELKDYFDGKTDDASVLRDNNINVDVDEILDRGVIENADNTLRYLVQRGSIGMQGTTVDGLTSLMMVECPEDTKTRMAIWFESDSARGETEDLTGSPGDPEAMRAFMSRFSLCGA